VTAYIQPYHAAIISPNVPCRFARPTVTKRDLIKEENMDIVKVGAVLLLVCGLILTVPPLNTGLSQVFGGTPIIQIVMGVVSVLFGIVLLVKRCAQS